MLLPSAVKEQPRDDAGVVASLVLAGLCGWLPLDEARAIQVHPTAVQVQAALDQGRNAAAARFPPDRLYDWFGPTTELAAHGFLLTKLGGIRVLSAHFALRAATPSPEEVQRILDNETLLVTVVVFGDRPDFALDSYMLLVQGERTITPSRVRFDGRASRSAAWPDTPAYRAKVVATVPYADLDPHAVTRISVFPGGGGEFSFRLDLSAIE